MGQPKYKTNTFCTMIERCIYNLQTAFDEEFRSLQDSNPVSLHTVLVGPEIHYTIKFPGTKCGYPYGGYHACLACGETRFKSSYGHEVLLSFQRL